MKKAVFVIPLLLNTLLIASSIAPGNADSSRNWKSLNETKKIAVIPFFFCEKASRVQSDKAKRSGVEGLETTLHRAMSFRLQERKRFKIYPAQRLLKILRSQKTNASDFFANSGKSTGKTWDRPQISKLKALAKSLNVDAILVGEMHQSASIGDSVAMSHSVINPLDMSVKRVHHHVISPRVQAYLVSKTGAILWSEEQLADHPRSSPRTVKSLKLDLQEATEQVASQLTDSLQRLPPTN